MSVRALPCCDEIGPLRRSARSDVRHRLYDAADVAKLYLVSLLRCLGFPLDRNAAAKYGQSAWAGVRVSETASARRSV
jgi:DNA-binding transcriptional MerR regulator